MSTSEAKTGEPWRPWVWVIYKHPNDYPRFFVLRPQYMDGAGVFHYGKAELADTLAEARALLPFRNGVCFQAHPTDDPTIVETWMP